MAKDIPSESEQGAELAPPSPDAQRQRTTTVYPRPIQLAKTVTAAHVLITVIAIVAGSWAQAVLVIFSLVMFLLGAVIYAVAFVMAAGRSRDEELWFGGAFFLTESVAAQEARRPLYWCLGLQTVTGIAGAVIAPFTAMAFGILVPLFALGSLAWYGARWGEFSPKAPPKPRAQRVNRETGTKKTPSNKASAPRAQKKKSGSRASKPLQRAGTDDGETTQKGSKE